MKNSHAHNIGIRFSDADDMTADLDAHPSGQSFVPSFVPESKFADTGHPKDHLVNASTDYQYECTTCRKSFDCKRKWQYHMAKHSTDNKWICSFCGKHVSTKGALKGHESRHSEKEYACTLFYYYF